MAERIVLFTGSDRDFEEYLDKDINPGDETVEFLELIRKYNAHVRASDLITEDFELDAKNEVDNCIVRATDFGSVLAHVISNFASIVTQAYDLKNLYVQNPPTRVRKSLESFFPGMIEEAGSEYREITKDAIKTVYDEMAERVLGQKDCKREIALSLYRLHSIDNSRPVVIMFYGPSGVGKTESAKCLSEALGGGLTRIQISMMQTTEAYEYIFGAEHSKGSFARDLLCRESNVVLLDEFDKVNASLYNAFYQLFDEGEYVDTNYDVDMRNGIFILTSNFSSEAEIKRELGAAMFSRIGACVAFDDLPLNAKKEIARRHYSSLCAKLENEDRLEIETTDIEEWFQENAGRFDNMRIMKTKIERAIFGHLTDKLLELSKES